MTIKLAFPLKQSINFQRDINQSTEFEQTALALLFTIVLIGIVLFYKNVSAYKSYVGEDRIVEWLTVIALFNCFIINIKRFFQLISLRSSRFLTFLILFSLMFLFGAGEEISWGQRIFNIQSPDFFMKYNSQNETNIHNLVFHSVRINKLIFSSLLGVFIFFYLLVLPFFYNKKEKIKNFIDSAAIPVPRIYHIVTYMILIIIIDLFKAPDKWELLELVGSFMFFLIFINPKNIYLFKKIRQSY